jgi:hypothetical protein
MADSEKYFTKVVDGQLSVATVSQSGEIIPEESRPGDVYTTALVDTDNGPQLCVKTFDLNGGGGGGGTVDQTYDPTSTNAQSGTAVAEAVAPALKNKSTQTSGLDASLTLCTNDSISTTAQSTVCIQPDRSNNNLGNDSVVVGSNAGGGNTSYIVAIGSSAQCSSIDSVCIGYKARTSGSNSISIGSQTRSDSCGIALGAYAKCGPSTSPHAIAIGGSSSSSNCTTCSKLRAIAIGSSGTYNNVSFTTASTAQDAIQLGVGTNNTAKTLQVFEFQLLDGNTGYIPADRLGTGFDATKTQVLKNVNGTLTWVDE